MVWARGYPGSWRSHMVRTHIWNSKRYKTMTHAFIHYQRTCISPLAFTDMSNSTAYCCESIHGYHTRQYNLVCNKNIQSSILSSGQNKNCDNFYILGWDKTGSWYLESKPLNDLCLIFNKELWGWVATFLPTAGRSPDKVCVELRYLVK